MRRLVLSAESGDAHERLDRFIAERGGISRQQARRALDAGGVFVDGRRCKVASRGLHPGQKVEVNLEEGGRPAGQTSPLEKSRLLYLDDDLLAVDKPSGIPSQATLTSDRGTLPEMVSALIGEPVILVHRLDRDTSGVMLFARNHRASLALAEGFRNGTPKKLYLAITARAPRPPHGRLEAPLGKDPGRPGLRRIVPGGDAAVTGYRTIAEGPGGALVEARPETGRTHQIRVHLAHLGAPLLGDARYGGPRKILGLDVDRVLLHAARLEIVHPSTGSTLLFEAPPPKDFLSLAGYLLGPEALPRWSSS